MRHLRLALILPAALALGACAELGMDRGGSTPAPAPVTPGKVTSSNPSVATEASGTAAGAAAAANAAGAPPDAAAGAAQAAGGALGTTTASLGDISQGGLWLKTPLVQAPRSGRVVDAATGRSADVNLLPLGGPASGGSQISAAAMQALGLGLTDLPQLRVFGA